MTYPKGNPKITGYPRLANLILMVGLPYSGKSTRARDLGGIPVVSPDTIRLAIHGHRFIPSAEPLVWATAHVMVDALFLAGHQDVILDACNITVSKRNEWKSPNWYRTFLRSEWAEDKEICLQRARRAGDTYIIPVITKMFANFEAPTAAEYDRVS